MTKAKMIDEIIGALKSAAIVEGKYFDAADTFFSLAFMSAKTLKGICNKIGINTPKRKQ